jgi:tripartite ATP-independent transporter DctP family solute receptor
MMVNHTDKSRRATRRDVMAGLAGLTAVALAAPHVARAAPRTVRLGHTNPDQSHLGRGATTFAAAVASDPVIGGVLKIDVHGNAELGDDVGMLKNCASGTLDAMICANVALGNLVPESNPINAPFLFRDVARARSVLDGPVGVEFAELALAKRLQVLAWGENGLRHITSSTPVRRPADLRGLRVRVPQSEMILGAFRALGADAGTLSATMLYEGLRTGQFQAQENAILTIEFFKLYEVQKFLSLTGHIYDPALFLCSIDLMDDLTAPQRSALIACARIGATATRDISDAASKASLARLKAAGMIVLDDIDVAGFVAASRPYLESLAARYGAERVGRLIEAGA